MASLFKKTQGPRGDLELKYHPRLIDGILQPSEIPENNRHALDRRYQKRRRNKKRTKPASRRKRKDRYQGVRIGEAKNPGPPPFFKKVADSVPFEVTKVVECIFGANCHCPTHRHRKKGEMNPAMRRILAAKAKEGKLEWKPVKYRVCQHSNRARNCSRCSSMQEAHYHSEGEEKQAHSSVKLYADCEIKQQDSEIDDPIEGELAVVTVHVQPEVPQLLQAGAPAELEQDEKAELELPVVNGDEAKHQVAPDQAELVQDEGLGAGNDPPVQPPPEMANPHPEDDGGGDEENPGNEEPGGFDYTLAEAYEVAERVISTSLDSKEMTSFWTDLKTVFKRANPLLREVPDLPDLPGEFCGSIPVSTYNTTHFSYIWKDVDSYNPGRCVTHKRRTEFFNYVRSIYNDHRIGDVNMDMLRSIMRNDKLLLPKYINGDGQPMSSVFQRVNFVATKLPQFSVYIKHQNIYINTVAYAVNCLTYRYMIMQSSLPGTFKPCFHSGPASLRQR